MRILITGRGFDSRHTQELGLFELDQARALCAAGHDVRFAAVDTRSVRQKRPFGLRRYTVEGIPVYYCAVPTGPKPNALAQWGQQWAADLIWGQLRREDWRPEVIHAHFSVGFLSLAKRERIPFVFTEHFSGANQTSPSPARIRQEIGLYRQVDRLLCVSTALSRRIREQTGCEARVIHNIVDAGAFSAALSGKSAADPFSFVSVGSLIPLKGFDLLLEAVARLKGKGVRLSLTIIGEGRELSALQESAEALGIAGQVAFTGRLPREQIAAIFRDSSAFVLPSRSETFGVAYVEAMAAGLPVIATRCGGPEDFVRESNGILVPTEDVPALAEAMERMILTREQYDSAAIAAFAQNNFSPETIAARLEEIYREVIPC